MTFARVRHWLAHLLGVNRKVGMVRFDRNDRPIAWGVRCETCDRCTWFDHDPLTGV